VGLISLSARRLGMTWIVMTDDLALGVIYVFQIIESPFLTMDFKVICEFTCLMLSLTIRSIMSRKAAHELKGADMERYVDLRPYTITDSN
jgi:hypothetical protein